MPRYATRSNFWNEWQSSGTPLERKITAYFEQFPGVPDVSRARLVSPVLGYSDYPNLTRKANFTGAAFVGDAALSLDPLSGVGCGFAAVSARMLANATVDALSAGGNSSHLWLLTRPTSISSFYPMPEASRLIPSWQNPLRPRCIRIAASWPALPCNGSSWILRGASFLLDDSRLLTSPLW